MYAIITVTIMLLISIWAEKYHLSHDAKGVSKAEMVSVTCIYQHITSD